MSSQVIRFWGPGDASPIDAAREANMSGDRARTAKTSLSVKVLGGNILACILSRGMRYRCARRGVVCLDPTIEHSKVRAGHLKR